MIPNNEARETNLVTFETLPLATVPPEINLAKLPETEQHTTPRSSAEESYVLAIEAAYLKGTLQYRITKWGEARFYDRPRIAIRLPDERARTCRTR